MNNELKQAILDQDIDKVEELITVQWANVTFPDERGNTALNLAVESGNLEILNFIKAGSPDFNQIDSKGHTPLTKAVSKKNLEVVQWLVDNGADVNARAANEETALDIGVADKQILEYLLKKGADVNAKSNSGETALMSACRFNYTDSIETLLKHNADMQIQNDTGLRAFDYSMVHPLDVKSMEILIENGLDLDDPIYGDHKTILMQHLENNENELGDTLSGDDKILNCILENGANVNAVDSSEKTPVVYAAEAHNEDVMKKLLSYGATPQTGVKYFSSLSPQAKSLLTNSKKITDMITEKVGKAVEDRMGEVDSSRDRIESIANSMIFSSDESLKELSKSENFINSAIEKSLKLNDRLQKCEKGTQDFMLNNMDMIDFDLQDTNPKQWDVAKMGTKKALVNLATFYGDQVKSIETLEKAPVKRIKTFIDRIPQSNGKVMGYSVGEDEAKVVSKKSIPQLPDSLMKQVASFLAPGDVNLSKSVASRDPNKRKAAQDLDSSGGNKRPRPSGKDSGGRGI